VGLLSFLFKKNNIKKIAADLSVLHVDVHSHLIPGIDDGAQTMEEAIALLLKLKEMGYRKIITTPHTMIDYYKNTPEIIQEGVKLVNQTLKDKKINLEVEASSEYFLDQHFLQLIEENRLLPFGDNYILFELSFMTEPKLLGEAIFQLQLKGYKPILAHVERYNYWHNNYEKFQEIKDKGVFFQLNLNSLTGVYNESTKKAAEYMIEQGMYEFLGSDCHHMRHIELMGQAVTEPSLHSLLESGKLLNHTL